MQIVLSDIILPLPALNYDDLSDEEFFKLCAENETSRIERDSKRQIILMPPTESLTAINNLKIGAQLELWNQKKIPV